MIEKIFKQLQDLQEKLKKLPSEQQATLTSNIDNLSLSLQELALEFHSLLFPNESIAKLERLNSKLEIQLRKQAARIGQLEEQLQQESRQYRSATQALTKGEARLQTLLRNSSDLITIVEADGRIREQSPVAVERILGYKLEPRLGGFQDDFLHPDDVTVWQTYFAKLLEQPGIARPIEYRKRHAEGYWVYLEVVANNLLHDSSINGIVIISRDITERKISEAALRESESHYRILSQITSDFAYSFNLLPDKTWACDWMTEAFTRITGYTPSEIETSGWLECDCIHPDDREMLLEQIQSRSSSCKEVSEYRIITKTGEIRWLWDCRQVVWDEAEGQAVRIYGACQDITEHKLVEAKLCETNQILQSLEEKGNLKSCSDRSEPFWARYVRIAKILKS
ncbi:MAG: PAS domain S-box protein [Microcoleus sp. CSU_2_2]|nr:PAS domain S-box protein [Microcoleus sp. SU_5_3]NJS09092.1 PAS domain S-box protein [Microcoleus sp. CSU_2_2]